MDGLWIEIQLDEWNSGACTGRMNGVEVEFVRRVEWCLGVWNHGSDKWRTGARISGLRASRVEDF